MDIFRLDRKIIELLQNDEIFLDCRPPEFGEERMTTTLISKGIKILSRETTSIKYK